MTVLDKITTIIRVLLGQDMAPVTKTIPIIDGSTMVDKHIPGLSQYCCKIANVSNSCDNNQNFRVNLLDYIKRLGGGIDDSDNLIDDIRAKEGSYKVNLMDDFLKDKVIFIPSYKSNVYKMSLMDVYALEAMTNLKYVNIAIPFVADLKLEKRLNEISVLINDFGAIDEFDLVMHPENKQCAIARFVIKDLKKIDVFFCALMMRARFVARINFNGAGFIFDFVKDEANTSYYNVEAIGANLRTQLLALDSSASPQKQALEAGTTEPKSEESKLIKDGDDQTPKRRRGRRPKAATEETK